MPLSGSTTYNLPTDQPAFPRWLIYFFVLTIFSKEIGHVWLFGIDYDLIGYNFALLYWLFVLLSGQTRLKIPVLLFFLGLLVVNLAHVFGSGYPIGPFLKQYVPILLIYLTAIDFLLRTSRRAIFELYVELGFYTALFGIVQFGLSFAGIHLLTPFTGRLDSIAYEPSHYAALIMPAVTYSLFHFKRMPYRTAVFVLALILTRATTSYLVLLLVIALANVRWYYFLLTGVLGFLFFKYVLLQFEDYQYRAEGFFKYFEEESLEGVHGTPLSFLSNLEVAIESVKRYPLFGSGLGGHETTYYDYYAGKPYSQYYLFGLNAKSAHNLSIRILSETGIVGFLLYAGTMVRCFITDRSTYHYAISLACISHFLCKSLKLGGYFDYGTPFFLVVLILNFIDYRQSKKLQRA